MHMQSFDSRDPWLSFVVVLCGLPVGQHCSSASFKHVTSDLFRYDIKGQTCFSMLPLAIGFDLLALHIGQEGAHAVTFFFIIMA